jgi:hypothetical protein
MSLAAGLVLMLAAAQPAPAQIDEIVRPQIFQNLTNCRAITDDGQRLACYDRAIAEVDDAVSKKELVVLDQAEIGRTRRTLFGLAIPRLNIFGGDSDESSEITTTIQRAWMHSPGKWAFELPDGARWEQIDTTKLAFAPEPGQPVRIRRAALGSFLANVDRQVAIRVRRIQ